MADIATLVDALETKVLRLLDKLAVLESENKDLKTQLTLSEKQKLDQSKAIAYWQQEYDALKMANAILGSNQNKKEAKLKINTLIREIDACIAQLSQ